MNRLLNIIIKLLMPLFLMVYGEPYFFKILSAVGLKLKEYPDIVLSILNLVYYLLIFALVYFLNKEDIKSDFKRFKRNLFPNMLMIVVFFIALTLGIKITDFLVNELATIFSSNYTSPSYINIFKETLNVELIIYTIKNIILIPFIYVVTIILGVNNQVSGKKKAMLLSGILGMIVYALKLDGSISYIIFTSIPNLVVYASLSYIYRKNNSNIWFSKLTILFYTLLGIIVLEKIS